MLKSKSIAFIVGIIIIVGAGGFVGYMLGQRGKQPLPVVSNPDMVAVDSSTIANSYSGNMPDSSQTVSSSAYLTDAVIKSIKWEKPTKANSLGLFINGYADEQTPDSRNSEKNVAYYRVGTFNSTTSSGVIYFIQANQQDLGDAGYYLVFAFKGGPLVINQTYSGEVGVIGSPNPNDNSPLTFGLLENKFTVDSATISPLANAWWNDSPQIISGAAPRQKLQYQGYIPFNKIADEKLSKIFFHPALGDMYTDTSTNGLYTDLIGPFRLAYSLKPDFFVDDQIPQITWNDGTKNNDAYGYTIFGGCGSTNFLNVVTNGSIGPDDLVEVGKNNQGDSIFAAKNINSKYLKDIYNNSYWVQPDEKKINYDNFIAARPVLYWFDPFDRLVELQNRKFMPQAECGKPVIYLYPEKTQAVSVKLEPKGGFTYTEPVYNSGWNVVAEPNGQLTEKASGQKYPYLFWEGRGGIYETPKQGWVVKQSDVAWFLRQKLSELGLNQKESADFMEFWLPRMQEKPYYFITFMGNSTMDKLAPLNIEPKPDTVIRILMDFTSLDNPVNVQPFRIPTPERRGFTVVEWGGVLR